MQLYEEVCDAEGCNDIGCRNPRADGAPATIMLLPPQFSVLNESRLPELVQSPVPAHQPTQPASFDLVLVLVLVIQLQGTGEA